MSAEDQKQKRGIDLSNINIGLKEFIAAIVFVASLSGVYYNLYYKQDAQRVDFQNKVEKLQTKLEALEKQINTNTDNIKTLLDDKTARDAVNNAARNQPNFVPMQRVK